MFAKKRIRLIAVAVVLILAAAMAILMAGIMMNVGSEPAQEIATVTTIQYVLSESLRYYRDCGRWPLDDSGERLAFTNTGKPNWHGPYIHEDRTDCYRFDSWGSEVFGGVSGERLYVTSAGADFETNTTDDVVGWISADGRTNVKSPKFNKSDRRRGSPFPDP